MIHHYPSFTYSFKKVQGVHHFPSQGQQLHQLSAMPGVILKQASSIRVQPHGTWRPVSNGTISNNGTAKEPCCYSMAHGEKNMGIWKCFRFFSRENAHRIGRCKLKLFGGEGEGHPLHCAAKGFGTANSLHFKTTLTCSSRIPWTHVSTISG